MQLLHTRNLNKILLTSKINPSIGLVFSDTLIMLINNLNHFRFYYASFNQKYDIPFPYLKNSLSYDSAGHNLQSIFNLTILKLPSSHAIIFNTDAAKK